MDNFNGTVLGSRQGSIAWRFRSTKTLDGIDQSPSCWSMVFLRSGILGIRLSAANSVSYEALWIHWQSIQPRLVRFCDITWSWITWLENFYEAYCYYFGCGCLYSRYWTKRVCKLYASLIMSHAVSRNHDTIFLNFDQVDSLYFGSWEIWPRCIFGTFVESGAPIGWSWPFSIQWCQPWAFFDCFMSR